MPPFLSLLAPLRIERRLLLTFFVIAVLVLAFVSIASEVREGDTLTIDRQLLLMLRDRVDPAQPIGPAWLRPTMVDLTALGGVSVLTLLTLIVIGFLAVARRWSSAVFVAVATSGGAVVSIALKALFLRDRPDVALHLIEVSTTSFPSGHAMNSAVVYLTLGALLARTQTEWRLRAYLMSVAILLTLTVGVSRVYIGVHWPSDVLAGWCVGAGWAGLCSEIARLVTRAQRHQPA